MKHNVLGVLTLLGILATGLPASAVETISGRVLSATSGLPIAGVDLDVYDDTGASVAITGGPSNTFGRYTVVLPGPGTYRIRADPATAQPFATQYWSGVFLRSQATPLVVGAGAALSGIDFSLADGVLVSGTISAGGIPLDAIDIDVYASNGEFLSSYPGTSQIDGTYTVGALPPGSYFVRADPDSTLDTQLYADAFFGGSMNLSLATPITVGPVDVAGIDIALVPGGTIGGTVTDLMTGLALPGLDLDLFDSLGNRISVSGKTALDGTYQMGAVPSGSYLLRVDPTIAQGYARTYYTTSATESGATPISVTAGARRTAINFSIDLGGTISGVIRTAAGGTPVFDIDLDLFDSLGRLMSGYTAKSDAAGAYQLGPMQAGMYFVRADPAVAQGYAEQYYDGQADIGTASAVTVGAGLDTGNVDFALVPAGAISGTVLNQALAALPGIDLDLFDSTGMRLRKGAATEANGTFVVDSLAPGSYFVRADPTPAQGYAQLYYDASVTRSGAQAVVVSGGATSTGVLFVLPLAVTISGRVTTPQGDPLAAVDMDLYAVQGASFTRLDQGAVTDALGNYTISAVPPGDYVIRVQPDPSVSPPVYYGGTTDRLQATVLSPVEGQNLTGIDIVVSPTATTTTTMPAAQVCGDVTGEGFVTATDALFALRAAVGLFTCPLCACDVDDSGGVVSTDAVIILKKGTGQTITVACPLC